ncbi:efflux RND transporter periplasmic adaptor subunit [Lichenihabitans sp. Uapishka_5]|uniref:efflux RND transporter periplasmic adaptor subunit n=1 Tax=Lichenihabitans sp. Uapishka_5 TaxID=3037302 RepID=UPI0029E7CF1B|nr:efflux RND transporter periplasmic adaptor subunit [Lichenihabitans sp. Uapishka_5]MDX7953225.1 efflux RND transporter periplasmic adaptor subunit [Lichenihabitans sp. Uapishka_5]
MSGTQSPKRRSWFWPGVLILLVALGVVVAQWRRVEPWGAAHLGPWVATIEPWLQQHAGPVMRFAGDAPTAPAAPTTAAAKPSGAVPVTVAQVRTGSFPVVLTGLGTVEPYNSVLVRSRVDGQIVKLNFKEGDLVEKGDVLVEIDPRPYRAALEQAQAKKQQDDATLSNSKRDLDRYASLAKSDYATRQQLDTQTSQVAQLTGQIAADQAAIDNAQTQLDYATIRAPIKGRVGFRLVDQGNIVNAATTTGIVQINQIKPISVIFTQPEDQLTAISAGLRAGALPVTALSTDGMQTYADGKLEVFNNEVDAASGTIRLKATFDNADKKLWPGLSVATRMTVSTRENATLVSANALLRGQAGFYAYAVTPDGKAEMRPLKVTLMNQQDAVVDAGLKAGDTVVVAGQYRLQGGTPVTVTNPGAPGADKAAGADKTASAASSSTAE